MMRVYRHGDKLLQAKMLKNIDNNIARMERETTLLLVICTISLVVLIMSSK